MLKECDLHPLLSDECIFSNSKTGSDLLIIAVYVDDLNIIGSPTSVELVKSKLKSHFEITDKGQINDCLGLTVNYNISSGIMKLNQTKYCNEMLYKFLMNKCSPAAIPIGSKIDLFTTEDSPTKDNELYTRPDLSYVVNILARFASNPLEIHLTTAKRS